MGSASFSSAAFDALSIHASLSGHLPGKQSALPRGDLLAIEFAVRAAAGPMCDIIDNASIVG